MGRARVADALAAGRTLEIVGLIREDTRSGLAEAKNTYQHLVREAGKCHRCGTTIADVEFADCPRCEALNISV
jgi:rubrerythrin